jgi:hypothetical protein
MNNDIENEIRRLIMGTFIIARAVPENFPEKSIYEYDFDLATDLMQKFRGLTVAAMRSKINNASNN